MGARRQDPNEQRRMLVHLGVERLVAEVVADMDPEAFEVRPPWPGAEEPWGRRREPLALPAIEAARLVMHQAMRAEREALEHARGQGKTWTEIGKALGDAFVQEAKRREMPLAEAAWRYATYRVMPDQEVPWSARWSIISDTFRWRCWTCAQWVSENHPDHGPDAEQGHSPGCARLAARRRQGYR